MKKIVLAVILIVLLFIGDVILTVISNNTIDYVKDCKVKVLKDQQIIKGSKESMNTEMRYLIITDKETFICESNFLQGKFDNSQVFYSLEQGHTYDLKVSGFHKGFFFDYRNVLETTEIK